MRYLVRTLLQRLIKTALQINKNMNYYYSPEAVHCAVFEVERTVSATELCQCLHTPRRLRTVEPAGPSVRPRTHGPGEWPLLRLLKLSRQPIGESGRLELCTEIVKVLCECEKFISIHNKQ